MGERSRRDDLAEAFDSHEEEDEQEELEEEGGSEEDTEEPLGDTEAAEGEGEPEDDDAEDDEPVAEVEPQKAKGKPAKIKAGPGEKLPGEVAAKAPVSWKPEAKEVWATLPKQAQEEVLRREREIENYHNSTKHERQLASQFMDTVRPFEPLIASQNSTPMQAVRNLMTTAAGLTLGTPIQKAQILSNIIQQYGVDIEALDEVLSGQVAPDRQQDHNLSLMLEQKLAPIQGFIQEIKGMRQTYDQRQAETTETQIEQFASSHDFFEDVRMDMADIMEMAAKRGQELSMEDAYKRAVGLNPEISSIFQRREKVRGASQKGSTIRRKRNAASSVRGAPAGRAEGSNSASIRGAIEAAWDEASG